MLCSNIGSKASQRKVCTCIAGIEKLFVPNVFEMSICVCVLCIGMLTPINHTFIYKHLLQMKNRITAIATRLQSN